MQSAGWDTAGCQAEARKVDNHGIPQQVSRAMGSTAMSASIPPLPPCSIPSPVVAAMCGVGRHRATGDYFLYNSEARKGTELLSPRHCMTNTGEEVLPKLDSLPIPWGNYRGLRGEPKGKPCPPPGQEDYVGENNHHSPCAEQ